MTGIALRKSRDLNLVDITKPSCLTLQIYCTLIITTNKLIKNVKGMFSIPPPFFPLQTILNLIMFSYQSFFSLHCIFSISSQLHTDQTTLLLYLLLHRNPTIASYLLSRTDIDHLVSRNLPCNHSKLSRTVGTLEWKS